MNIISAVLQIGAVVFAIVATMAFNWAEAQVIEERNEQMVEPDLSDCPPFLDE